MKIDSVNPNYRAALALIVMAFILVATAILTNRGDFTTAALVIAGLVCLMTGIFFMTISGSDPIDLRYMSLLPVQGSINFVRICADMGVQGNACFLPKGRDGRERTMQFLPVAAYTGAPLSMESFVSDADAAGILAEPTCAPLYALLLKKEHLAIPSDMAALHGLIMELGVEVLDVTPQIRSLDEGGIITITMEDYQLIDGCRAMYAESPRCCVVNPCPVCSLYATVLAEGLDRNIQLEQCTPGQKQMAVTAVFSILPE
ncbi:MAG: hypothetical protein M0Q92_08705 [Methanoregula sp.]|jgi:hypothetical protein|nr:hypothetical protein [Methanoregula sp.]